MGESKAPDENERSTPGGDDPHIHGWALLAGFLDQYSLTDGDAVERFLAEHPDDERALREILRGFHSIRADAAVPDTGESTTVAEFDGPEDDAFAELLRRVRADIGSGSRFSPGERIGSGGIGVVYKLWDANLHRHVAKKSLRADMLKPNTGDRIRWIARFLEEAQITAQLDHPGVVPIHDIGFESDGQIYFTMRFVRGDTLADVLRKFALGDENWNRTRVVSALLRVCETVAFAHGKKVIHRDLKPANIMIGRYGETYVMDWGLARKLGVPDLRDLRIRPPVTHSTEVLTDARGVDDSGLFTLDGHAIGTPSYMAPEQAAGDLARVAEGADVHSLGAILYEVLAGHPPYQEPGVNAAARTICRWVIDGPPAPLSRRAPDAPAELVAIAEKAMARDSSKRYPTVEAMADDLRAYLEHRVVKAYRTGPLSELAKWFSRNRLPAVIATLLLFTIAGAGYVAAYLQQQRHDLAMTAADAERARSLAEEGAAISIYDPTAISELERWLASERDLQSRRSKYEARFHELEKRGAVVESAGDRALTDRLIAYENRYKNFSDTSRDIARKHPEFHAKHSAFLLRVLEGLRAQQRYNVRRRYDSPDDEREFLQIAAILRRLPELRYDGIGLATGIEGRLEAAKAVAAARMLPPDPFWQEFAAIASGRDGGRYRNTTLDPIPGWIPLRQDPESGLLEFLFEPSGARPAIGADGRWQMREETGMVFVLIPSGDTEFGYQSADPKRPNYRRKQLNPAEPDVTGHVSVSAFLVSKYEMTQAQWWRLTGSNPSSFQVGVADGMRSSEPDDLVTWTHPVESLTHRVAERTLAAWGLALPTQAEWLLAAGGVGPEQMRLVRSPAKTIAPRCNVGQPDLAQEGVQELVFDGYMFSAPVDAYDPNANGLFQIQGNVAELVADPWVTVPKAPTDTVPVAVPPRWMPAPTVQGGRTICGTSYDTVDPDFQYRSLFSLRRRCTADDGQQGPPIDGGVRPVFVLGR